MRAKTKFSIPAIIVTIALLLSISATSHVANATTSWPKAYCFFGRWDLRAADRAITVNSGSYVLARFSGASISASFDLALNQPTKEGAFPTITWRIDDGEWHDAEIAASVKLADGLAEGAHTIMLMVRGIDEHQSRWKAPLVASVTFAGFTFAAGGEKFEEPLDKWLKPAITIEFLGDSITEGVLVQEGRAGVVPGMPRAWPWLTDARSSYAGQTALALDAQWRQVGFGATGLKHGGSGGAPGALDSFNFFYADCPRDYWQPDVVIVSQGTNDPKMPAAEYQPLYTRYLEMIRTAYPKTKIVALRPFNGAQEKSIQAATQARHAAGDANIYYIDTTGWYEGPVHPNAADSAALAEKLERALKEKVLATRSSD